MVPNRSICTFGLTILLSLLVKCNKIHELPEEYIAKVFRSRRENIPEYDIVKIRHNAYKRSSSLRMEFTAFGKEIAAYLEPSDGILAGEYTPVWLAYTEIYGKVQYRKLRYDTVGTVTKMFDRLTDYSTIAMLQTPQDGVYFRGVIDDLSVIPLPLSDEENSTIKRYVKSSKKSRTLVESHPHLIIKSPSINGSDEFRNLERQIRKMQLTNKTKTSKSKRSKQEIIFPSILVTTDFATSKTTHDSFYYFHEIIYQLAFWNAVDLRFRSVEDPKIRLRIVGMILGLDRPATPYLDKYRNENVIQMDEAYRSMQEYWARMTNSLDFPLKAYDIIMTMTDNTLYKKTIGEIRGTTVMNTFCTPYDEPYALGVSQDNGAFNGVLTVAHELGHMMGLFHDGNTGDECDQSNSFIMRAGRIPGPKNLQWSPCSLKSLSRFLRKKKITCADEPAKFHPSGPEVRRFLPGEIAGITQQCQARGYDMACEESSVTCTNMECQYTGWHNFYGWWCKSAGPAAEGTICSPDHRCVDGVCRCMTDECIFDEDSTNDVEYNSLSSI